MRYFTATIPSALALSVCALSGTLPTQAVATPAEDMAAMLQGWVGKRESTLLDIWGNPAQLADRGRLRLLGYFGEGSNPSLTAGGFTAIAGGTTGCLVTFEINPSGVVSEASWSTEGAADRSKARRACWREFRRNAAP